MSAAQDTARGYDAATAARIAAAFLPPHWYGNRWHYYYARIKLASDPLYPGVVAALRGSSAPLLDLGCGAGLLAHALREGGLALDYRGIDNDAGKLAVAQRAAIRASLAAAVFEHFDLATQLPAHHGSVAILDVLQYLDDPAQARLLDAAIAMLAPAARLVIRTGLDDDSRRARTSRRFDQLAHGIGWMNAGPRRYPQREALQARLEGAGLATRFSSLSGRTPFNNWLVVAER